MTPQKRVLFRKGQDFFKLSSLTTLLLALLLCAGSLSAQTIVVTSSADSGPNTLREAILTGTGDVITFDPSVTIIKLTTGLTINRSLTIDGAGKVTIERDPLAVAPFSMVKATTPSTNIILRGLAIQGAQAQSASAINVSGAVTFTIDACTIQNNVSEGYSDPTKPFEGAVYASSNANITIKHSTFDNNKTVTNANNMGRGAALFVYLGAKAIVSECVFTNNSAFMGGAVFNRLGTLSIEKSLIKGNSTAGIAVGGVGGTIYTDGAGGTATTTLIQNTITGNQTTTSAAAVACGDNSTNYLYNNTIVGNTANEVGGVSVFRGAKATLVGNIIAGNSGTTVTARDAVNIDAAFSINTGVNITSAYNIFSQGTTTGVVNTLDGDVEVPNISTILKGTAGTPFVPTISYNTNNTNGWVMPLTSGLASLRILPSTLLVSPVSTSDQRNIFINTDDSKYCAGSVSMSLCPVSTNNIWYVNQSLAGATAYGEGLTAAYPFKELSEALENGCLQDGDTIKVDNGTFDFTSSINLTKSIAIIGTNNSAVIQRSPAALAANKFSMINAATPSTNILLRGLTIQGAQAESASAINVSGAVTLTIDTCTIKNNTSVGYAPAFPEKPFTGAVYAGSGATLTMTRSILDNNAVQNANNMGRGAALFVYLGATVNASKCVFTNNNAYMGGAIFNKLGILNVEKSLLKDNTATVGGAAFYTDADNTNAPTFLNGATTTLKQNTITGNQAAWSTAVACGTKSANYLYNNTIVGNTATDGTLGVGGVGIFDSATATLVGNIIAGNIGVASHADAGNNGGTIASSTYNIFSTGTATTVISADDQEVALPTDILEGTTISGTDYWIMPKQALFNTLNIVPSTNLFNLSDANDQRGVAIELNSGNYFAGSVSLACTAMTGGTITGAKNVCTGVAFTQLLDESVAAAGGMGTIAYQWQESTDGTTFTDISSATANTYSVSATLTADKWYRRMASGSICGISYSDTVKLTVVALPVPTISGAALTTAAAGSTQTYTTETGMTGYTWTVTNGTISSGAGTSSVTVTWGAPPTLGTIAVNYENANGCTAATATSLNVTLSANTQTLSVTPVTKTYGDAPFTLSATASSGLPVTFTVPAGNGICTLAGSTLTILKAGTVTVTANQAGNASISAVSETFDVTVVPAEMKVTVKDVTRNYGSNNPSFELVYLSPFKYSDTPASINVKPTASTMANTTSVPGRYVINLAGGSADNYTIVPVPAALGITMMLPTAFTPYDLDGKNDVFARGLDIKVFNRNGTLLYSGTNGWDGKYKGQLVTPTVYFYTAAMPDGSTKKGSIEVIK